MNTAIVTGASQGLGRALAMHLARQGWNLVIDARHKEALAATAARLATMGIALHAIPGDITDAHHRADLISAARSLGGLHLLISNASALGPSPLPRFDRLSSPDLRQIFEVNVFAPLALVQLALPLLRASRGTLVGISSDAAVEAYAGWGGYGSSKAAFDQALAVLGSEEPELSIYSFDPGDMRTAMQQRAFPGEDISDRPEPECVVPALAALLESSAPSGRYRSSDLVTS